MPERATPNAAVDRALEIALSTAEQAPRADIDFAGRLEDLEKTLARAGRERQAEAAAQRSAAAETLREVRAISALMSAVAAQPWADEPDGAASALSLRAWLDARAGAAPSATCVGRWRSKTRLGDGLVAMEFDAELAGQPGSRSAFRIERLDATSALAAADQAGPLTLACRRVAGGGWNVTARRLNADRTTGDSLGQFRV